MKTTPEQALVALDNLDDYARMGCSVIPVGDVMLLVRFIQAHSTPEDLRDDDSIRILNFFAREYPDTCGYDESEDGKDE